MTVPRAPKCPYCDRLSVLVGGAKIYPHRADLVGRHFYECAPCDARVGCHPNTMLPMGRLANAELRTEKQRAHAAFDPIWRSGKFDRKEAYAWLAEQLGITEPNCHIGMFDIDLCRRTVRICKEWRFAA